SIRVVLSACPTTSTQCACRAGATSLGYPRLAGQDDVVARLVKLTTLPRFKRAIILVSRHCESSAAGSSAIRTEVESNGGRRLHSPSRPSLVQNVKIRGKFLRYAWLLARKRSRQVEPRHHAIFEAGHGGDLVAAEREHVEADPVANAVRGA